MENGRFGLGGKVALVTGAGRGFGRAFSLALAEAGADVICVEKVKETLEETAELVRQTGQKVLPLVVDVVTSEDVERMRDRIYSEFGKLDIAVNNAGIIHKPYRFHEIPLEEWNRLIAIDLTGVFICMQKELQLMLKQKSGVIINISSVTGLVGVDPELTPRASYVAAKHAVIGLTKQAALEYAGDGIRVNAIAPAWFEGTDIARERLAGKDEEVFKHRLERIIDLTPMKRRGRVEELIGMLLYLASEASSFVTGQTFVIDGGWVTH
jgi:NAD(P)-dependent dehydrogenase (short-subunit alcohol dehydrogenase family)